MVQWPAYRNLRRACMPYINEGYFLLSLSNTLYHTLFTRGQECKWWFRRPKLIRQ